MGNYAKRYFQKVFGGKLRTAEFVASIATVTLLAITYFVSGLDGVVSIFMWAIPLTALLTTIVIGIIIAPYSIHREDRAKTSELEKLLKSKMVNDEICDKLGKLLRDGNEIATMCKRQVYPTPWEQYHLWTGEAEGYILDNIGKSYQSIFKNNISIHQTDLIQNEDTLQLYEPLCSRLQHIQDFIKEFCT